MKNEHSHGDEYSFKSFLPLILIVSIVVLFSSIRPIGLHAWNTHEFMRDFMGFFFIIFGSFKIWHLSAFAEAYSMYDQIAQRSKLYAHAYPFVELGLGVLYLARWHLMFVNVLTCIIMLISAAGVAYALSKKESIQCACLGTVFKIPMTYVTLIEDLLMAGMAGIMLVQ